MHMYASGGVRQMEVGKCGRDGDMMHFMQGHKSWSLHCTETQWTRGIRLSSIWRKSVPGRSPKCYAQNLKISNRKVCLFVDFILHMGHRCAVTLLHILCLLGSRQRKQPLSGICFFFFITKGAGNAITTVALKASAQELLTSLPLTCCWPDKSPGQASC